MITLIVIGGIILLLVVIVAGIYNGLVTSRNRYKNAYSQIDVQLKRRYDLIPNLVETAKGYMKHERETLEAVIAARNSAVNANQQASGNPGDAKAVGKGVSEMRIDYGPGYRVYYKKQGRKVVISLAGGNKSTQAKDIKTALRLAQNL